MKINIIAIGKNMPEWARMAFLEYAKRMPNDFAIHLVELPLIKRNKNSNIDKIKQQEWQKMQSVITRESYIIALDEKGKQYNTIGLSQQMATWKTHGREINLLIGGPDGLSSECLQKADNIWSLSSLTFPHMLVRVILAEQLYRAWSVLTNHPYHRI